MIATLTELHKKTDAARSVMNPEADGDTTAHPAVNQRTKSMPETPKDSEFTQWAQAKQCPWPESNALAEAWQFSQRRIETLRRALLLADVEVACVAVSGSLARMEAHPRSDVDLLVVLDDRERVVSDEKLQQTFADVWAVIEAAIPDIVPPKPGGVFGRPVSWRAVTDVAARGLVDEDVRNYGQRMQLLLDAQPVTNADRFEELNRSIIEWFSGGQPAHDDFVESRFAWLAHEIRRYWHSIAARAVWLHANEGHRWRVVNTKLRSSRAVLFAARLDSVNNAVDENELQAMLKQTPLQRLSGRSSFDSLKDDYQTVWRYLEQNSQLNDPVPANVTSACQRLQSLISR